VTAKSVKSSRVSSRPDRALADVMVGERFSGAEVEGDEPALRCGKQHARFLRAGRWDARCVGTGLARGALVGGRLECR
jgi:hypothetical protein